MIRNERIDFFRSELEHELLRKTPDIAFDRLVERLGGNPVKCCQIRIEDDFVAAEVKENFGEKREAR